jgi:hypothetical protein
MNSRSCMARYAITLLIAASICCLGCLASGREKIKPPANKQFEDLARAVTLQLLDTSYTKYGDNTLALLNGSELAPSAVTQLQEQGLLPHCRHDLQAEAEQLKKKRTLVLVTIDSVTRGTPSGKGFLPIDVTGKLFRSSEDAPDKKESRKFHFRYKMGLATEIGHADYSVLSKLRRIVTNAPPPSLRQSESRPIVVELTEIPGAVGSGGAKK